MRIHIEWGKALYAQSLRLELPSQDDRFAEDSAMITAVYEAHLCKEKMLLALAELRGDDAANSDG